MIAQHSSASVQHFTPVDIVERSRKVLGAIDLDPASCANAQDVIAADMYWNANGLSPGAPWHGRVFLNPPGGKLDRTTFEPIVAGPGISSAAVWWAKLWNEWNIGSVESAIFICFTMAVFRTAQEFSPEVPALFEFPFCIPRHRINYDRMVDGVRVPTKGAPADSAIVLIPPKRDRPLCEAQDRFIEQFSPLGRVRI